MVLRINKGGFSNKPNSAPPAGGHGSPEQQKKMSIVRYPAPGNAMRGLLDDEALKAETRPLRITGRLLEPRNSPSESSVPSIEAQRIAGHLLRLDKAFGKKETPSADIKPAAVGLPQLVPARITDIEDLGHFVRARRQILRLNQQQLADRAGVGRRFVCELEAGKSTLEVGKALRVCRVIGLIITAQVDDG